MICSRLIMNLIEIKMSWNVNAQREIINISRDL